MAALRSSLLLLALLALAASTSAETIYDLAEQFGFPRGILPDCVSSYSTVPDGEGYTFVINLSKPCYVDQYTGYLVYFDSTITGKVTYGKMSNLKGLKAQSWIFWLTVDTMTAKPDCISFTLGLLTVDIDIKEFQKIPTCRDNALTDCDHSSNLKLPSTRKNLVA